MPLSGREMLRLFLDNGWEKIKSKSGRSGSSHVKVGKDGERETIPMHDELAVGLEKKLLKRLRR